MSKKDRIFFAAASVVFIFMILTLNRTFFYSHAVKGLTTIEEERYTISLKGGEFVKCWRNFYTIEKKEEPLLIRIISPPDMLYAMINLRIENVNPQNYSLSGAAFSDVEKFKNGIAFVVRAGSRKDIIIKVANG